MNTRLKKIMKITAAGLFVVALAINIGVTLSDPFSTVCSQALADSTYTGDNGSSNNSTNGINFDTPYYPTCPGVYIPVQVTETTTSGASYSSGGSIGGGYGGASGSISWNGGSIGSTTTSTRTYTKNVQATKRLCNNDWSRSGCTRNTNCDIYTN